LPAAVDGVLARVLHQSPAERFTTCTEFVTALEAAFAGAPVSVKAAKKASRQVTLPSFQAAPAKSGTGRGIWYLTATMVVLLIGAAIGAYEFMPRRSALRPPPPEPPSANPNAGTAQKPSSPREIARSNSGPESIKQEVKSQPGQTVQQPVRADAPLQPGAIFAKGMEQRRAGNLGLAIDSFRQAAKLGDTKAMVELGSAAADGAGLPQSASEAMRWYRLAADGGNATAMLRLGGMYFAGDGVPEDPTASAQWFAKGSELGDAACKYNLGVQYESGSGVPFDLRKAEALYREAAALGNEEAQKRLLRMKPSR